MHFRQLLSVLIAAFLFGTAAIAQDSSEADDSSLTARQLFYTKRKKAPEKPAAAAVKTVPDPGATQTKKSESVRPPAQTSAAKPPAAAKAAEEQAPYLGLRYSLMQIMPNGSMQETDPDRVFRSGDRIKLKVQSNDSGFLYIVHQGSSGAWEVLFPSAEFKQGSNELVANQSVMIPAGDEMDFEFDEKPGLERIFIVLSTVREQNLDSLIYSLGKGAAAGKAPLLVAGVRPPEIPNNEVERLRTGLVSRDIRTERRPKVKSTGSNADRENAVYVVNTSAPKERQRVVAEIKLDHK